MSARFVPVITSVLPDTIAVAPFTSAAADPANAPAERDPTANSVAMTACMGRTFKLLDLSIPSLRFGAGLGARSIQRAVRRRTDDGSTDVCEHRHHGQGARSNSCRRRPVLQAP